MNWKANSMAVHKLELILGKDYLSYSAVDTLLSCGQKFKLERVEKVPTGNAWYFLGGSAVHEATETLDRELLEGRVPLSAQEAWDAAWLLQLSSLEEGDLDSVRAGGRATKEWPNKENRDWWEKNGPLMVQSWVDWRDAKIAEGWVLLGIETAFTITIGTTRVVGYIDRVFVNADGEAIVIDIKAGSHTPGSSLQLGVYRMGARQALGIDPILGGFWMARKGEAADPKSLLHYNDEYMARMFDNAKTMIEQELFIPHPTSMCSSCMVAQWCPAMGGVEPVPGFFKQQNDIIKEGVAA